MKNLKYLLMVIMMVALVVVVPACKKQDTVEQDDIQFVSLNTRVDQFDGAANVYVDSVVKIKTIAPTRVIGTIHFGSAENGFTMDILSTDGQWVNMSMPTIRWGLYSGTHEIKGEFTLESNGKMVVSSVTTVTVK